MPPPAKRAPSWLSAWCGRGVCAALALSLPVAAALAATPQIRTSASNTVPQCVTPEHLMSFLKQRNPNLAPRFANIAAYYKRHGERWGVRWDYAFFQMAVETNFLSYKRGNGGWGDVDPHQNNFAGLGTTGGGVAGDSYPDVSTGVLAQIQHLVVYSGQRIADPVGARTKLKQDDILDSTADLKGRTTFADLSRRWAADRHYGASIEWVASSFRDKYCKGDALRADAKPKANAKVKLRTANATTLPPVTALGGPPAAKGAAPASPVRTIWSQSTHREQAIHLADDNARPARAKPAVPTPALPERAASARARARPETVAATMPIVAPPPIEVTPALKPALLPVSNEEPRAFAFAGAMAAAAATLPTAHPGSARRCRVLSASYGGRKTLLVRADDGAEVRYTALTVFAGFEESMLAGYLKAHAPGGTSVGAFDSKDAALARARQLCPDEAEAPLIKGARNG